MTEKSNRPRVSSEAEVQRAAPEDDGAAESNAESVCGPECGVGVSSTAAPEGGEGGGGGAGGRGAALEFSRPGSENYLTASDDSSSLFDDDMQRTERPSFGLLEAALGAGKDGGPRGAQLDDCTSEELNIRFQSQRLDSSSSSSEPNTPSPIPTPKRPNPPQDPRDNPASPKQPRLRTPAGFGLTNVALAKKHLSQPPVASEAPHGQTRNALSMLRSPPPQETDLDQEQDVAMETGRDTPPQTLPGSRKKPVSLSFHTSPVHSELPESPEGQSSAPGNKPPTPPLHRLPSWVRIRPPVCYWFVTLSWIHSLSSDESVFTFGAAVVNTVPVSV